MGCALLHDIVSYFILANSPLYISSLDAEKCFDSIWHDGLFYKLYSVLPISHWMLLVTLGEPKRRESATLGVFAEKRRGKNLPLGIPRHFCRETPR